jgi:hypothetical protein
MPPFWNCFVDDTTAGIRCFYQKAGKEAPWHSWRCGAVFLHASPSPSSKNKRIFILKMRDGYLLRGRYHRWSLSFPPNSCRGSTGEQMAMRRCVLARIAAAIIVKSRNLHSQDEGRLR